MLDKSLKMKMLPNSFACTFPANKEEKNLILEHHINDVGLIFLTKQNKSTSYYLDSNKRLKQNFQDLLFDNVGKYAFFAYQKLKEKCKFLEETIENLEKNQKEFLSYHMEIYSQALKTKEKYNRYKRKFKTLGKYDTLTAEELAELMRNLNETIFHANSEQIHRIYKKEIKQLKAQINNKICSPSPNKNNKKFFEIDFNTSIDEEKEYIEKNFLFKKNMKSQNFNFQDFESKFLNNSLNIDYIFEKKNVVEIQKNNNDSKISPKSSIPKQKSTEKVVQEPIRKPVTNSNNHKRTKSVVPVKKLPVKREKRGGSMEKSVEITLSNKKTENVSKLNDLIEDKKILAENFIINKSNNIGNIIPNQNIQNTQKMMNFKEDAEILKDFVQKVSNSVNENMDNVKAKMQNPKNCHISDFFSEKDFFSNEKGKGFKDDDLNNETFDENGVRLKKRRTRAERNSRKI